MLYARTDISSCLSSLPLELHSPVSTAAQLAEEFSLEEPKMAPPDRPLSFQPLGSQPGLKELPLREGQLVVIDAEFVAVSQEETRRSPSGQTVVVKPARLALGRVRQYVYIATRLSGSTAWSRQHKRHGSPLASSTRDE